MRSIFFISMLIVTGAVDISAQELQDTYHDDELINIAATRTEVFMDRCIHEVPFDSIPRIVSLDSLISELPHIRIQDGYTVQCIVPGHINGAFGRSGQYFGLSSFIYARPVGMTQIDSTVLYNYPKVSYNNTPDIFDPLEKIVIPENVSKEFIWEAYLISRMDADLPLYWHMNSRKEIILSTCPWFLNKLEKDRLGPYVKYKDDPPDEAAYKAACVNHIEAVLRNSNCGPRCRNSYETKWITHWYWTNWGGLEARSITFNLTADSISFINQSHITIFLYDCGVMF